MIGTALTIAILSCYLNSWVANKYNLATSKVQDKAELQAIGNDIEYPTGLI